MAKLLKLAPISIREANEFVTSFHRHNSPVQGGKFAIAAASDAGIIGVAITGRPVARKLQDGYTLEVLRVCVVDTAPKGSCSFLYSRSWKVAQALGYRKLITYTLATESGASLRGAGWRIIGTTEARTEGKGWTSRPNRDWQPIYGQQKLRWEVSIEGVTPCN